MIGGSRASHLQRGGTPWRFAAALLAALITLFVMGSSGDALACPPGTKSHHATIKHKANKHKAKAATLTAHVVSVSSRSAAQNSASIGHCCDGTSSSAGSSCKASCCSTGSAIADVNLDGAPFFEIPISYFFCRQGDLSSLEPASHFRPPEFSI
jgi:hypothetical protein